MNTAAPRHFPETRDSLVQALKSTEPDERTRAFDIVARAYRVPVVALLARRWSLEHADAEDLAHEFFAAALEKEWLNRYDATKGRFRTFFRSCLFAFASDQFDRRQRLKRGGSARHESLSDSLAAEGTDAALDALFEQEWVRSVLQLALERLDAESERTGHNVHAQLFRRYDIEGSDLEERPTYAQLAAEFQLPATQVTNHLAWARRHFRQHVLDTVRELSGSDEEYRAEVHTLTGRLP